LKYSEANLGRIFILRLENGDRIPDTIEDFAKRKGVNSATVLFLGGAKEESKVVAGPKDGYAESIVPNLKELIGVSEALGVGTIFINEEEIPKLHLHSAFGRKENTITGCTREGVDIWHIGEVIILELINTSAQRKVDPETGFKLLEV